MDSNLSNNKWYILSLSAIVWFLPFSAVYNGTTVLFPEIATDLNLSYGDIGLIWGMLSTGLCSVAFVGGILGDRFGSRIIIGAACILSAISSFLRGTTNGLITLITFMFIFGMAFGFVEVNLPKIVATWFRERQLGLANGILITGWSLGAISLMVSASFLSPLLGGWRNVMHLYGITSLITGIIWLATIRDDRIVPSNRIPRKPLSSLVSEVIKSRDLWLAAVSLFMIWFSFSGVYGYLPIYFVDSKDMSIDQASTTVSIFVWVGILGSLVLPTISDKLGRKSIGIPSILITGICVLVIPLVDGALLITVITLSGIFSIGAFAMHYVVVAEAKGINTENYGTAFGIIVTMASIGGFLGPTVGGVIADVQPSLPFTLWAAVLGISLVCFTVLKGSKGV
jgi:MFS family permease